MTNFWLPCDECGRESDRSEVIGASTRPRIEIDQANEDFHRREWEWRESSEGRAEIERRAAELEADRAAAEEASDRARRLEAKVREQLPRQNYEDDT
jgi:hypothetical protein